MKHCKFVVVCWQFQIDVAQVLNEFFAWLFRMYIVSYLSASESKLPSQYPQEYQYLHSSNLQYYIEIKNINVDPL